MAKRPGAISRYAKSRPTPLICNAPKIKRLGEEVDPDEFAIDIANASLAARLNQR
jgi:hypothetical protein